MIFYIYILYSLDFYVKCGNGNKHYIVTTNIMFYAIINSCVTLCIVSRYRLLA